MKAWLGLLRILGVTLATLLILFFLILLLCNWPGLKARDDVHLGVTFSSRYATDLGLDWQATYLALLDDVGVKKMRLPVYWDLVEAKPGVLDYQALDWQIAEAKKRNTAIILVVGERVPRWPECHIPGWVGGDASVRESALKKFITRTIERYKNETAITTWQVENEPFLTFFGQCPPLNIAFLDEEVALVRELDPSRPVMLTDSGELSLWYRAASRGDAFGTTLYRKIYKGGIGYFTYPVGPSFFRIKAALVRLLTHQQNFSVIELQGEPWASGWVGNLPLEEQYKTLDAKQLEANVDYARKVGFPDIYLWGGEWWYWLKEKKQAPEVWDTARTLFQKYP